MLVVSGGGFVYAQVLMNKFNEIPQEDILGLDNHGDIDGALNLLMIGADLRVDADEEALADTIMILHVNENHDRANLVSIPRDLRVEIPDCGNGQSCIDKINHSYGYGGTDPTAAAKNLADAVTAETGVEFDGLALVDFEGFLDVVETFGGIELCLPHDLDAEHSDEIFPEGCQRYDPDDALVIVRERYAWVDGDYGRQRMQQHFMKQLLKEADDQGYVSDPTKVGPLIDDIGAQLLLDLGDVSPVDFAFAMRNVKPGDLENVKLPSEPSQPNEFGDEIDYVVIREGEQRELADSLYAALRDDTLDEWIEANPDFRNVDPGEEDEDADEGEGEGEGEGDVDEE